MRIGQLSQSLEDYLETIFRLQQSQKVVRVRDIARQQEVKTSSVVSALRRLAAEGLVDYQAREYVDLTPRGRDLGFRLYQRHTFLKRFLTDLLQVDPQTAEEDACSLEHSISVDTVERIAAMSEFLTYCPDVDVDFILNFRDRWLQHLHSEVVEGDNGHGTMCSLAEMPRGRGGYIARIAAEDELRRSLIQRGVLPGTSVEVDNVREDGSLDVRMAGERMGLSRAEAEGVQVWPQDGRSTEAHGPEDRHRTLADLTPGTHFRVVKVHASGEVRQRMTDMGFIRGSKGRILREALLRDPIEVELNGTLLSLRRVEATSIAVEEMDA